MGSITTNSVDNFPSSEKKIRLRWSQFRACNCNGRSDYSNFKSSTQILLYPKHISEVVSVDVFDAALGFVVRQEVGDAGADGAPGDRLLHLVDRRQVTELYVVRGYLQNSLETCDFKKKNVVCQMNCDKCFTKMDLR